MIKTPMMLIHEPVIPRKPIVIILKKAKKADIFTTDIINAVINEGEPWYTSGLHMWNGASETLNAKATKTKTAPIVNMRFFGFAKEKAWISYKSKLLVLP